MAGSAEKEQQKKKRALLVDAQSVRKNVNSLLHLMRKVEKRQERQRMSKEQVWCHARCCQLTKEQSVFVSLVAGLTISKVSLVSAQTMCSNMGGKNGSSTLFNCKRVN